MNGRSDIRILVIEDDEAYRRLVAQILQRAGFTVALASDFDSGMRVIESPDRLDLLLSDISLPAGTPHGLSIGRMAKSRRPDLKIIYMSGSYNVGEIAAMAEDAKVLPKPFFPKELMAAIETTLGLDPLPSASESAA